MRSSALFVALLFWGSAHADVTVSSMFVTDPAEQRVEIPAGRAFIVNLPGGFAGDRYEIQVDLGNQVYRDISAYVVDDANLTRFQRRERFTGEIRQKALAPFSIQYTAFAPGPVH